VLRLPKCYIDLWSTAAAAYTLDDENGAVAQECGGPRGVMKNNNGSVESENKGVFRPRREQMKLLHEDTLGPETATGHDCTFN
jgi:hypothetical protein